MLRPLFNTLVPSGIPSLHVNRVQGNAEADSPPSDSTTLQSAAMFHVEHTAPPTGSAITSSHVNPKDVSIQAKYPLHPASFVSYFEIKVLDLPRKAVAAIGLAPLHYPQTKQPGWQDASIGYHSDDGNIFLGHGRAAIELGMKFDVGDVVGCGLRWMHNSTTTSPQSEPHLEAFFTKNGKILVDGIKRNFSNIHPTVGLDHATVNITFNPQSFMFRRHLEQMEWTELARAQQQIEAKHIEQRTLTKIVRDYLIHEGYVETLQAFDKSCAPHHLIGGTTSTAGSDQPVFFSEEEKAKLSQRNYISNLIAQGHISTAVRIIQNTFPTLFSQFSNTEQILQYQLFIEYIREGNVPQALELLRGTLTKYHSLNSTGSAPFGLSMNSIFRTFTSSPERMSETVDCNDLLPPIHQIAGLIAYTDPQSSPLKPLLHQSRRELIADVVKRQLKVAMGFSKSEKEDYSVIERLMSQLLLTFTKAFSPTAEHEENSERNRLHSASFSADSSRTRRSGIFSGGRFSVG